MNNKTLEGYEHQHRFCIGILVYSGPRTEVVPFFEGLGFALPPRKGVADFLQEITSAKDQEVCAATLCLSSFRKTRCSPCLDVPGCLMHTET